VRLRGGTKLVAVVDTTDGPVTFRSQVVDGDEAAACAPVLDTLAPGFRSW